LLKIIKIISALTIIILATYSLITGETGVIPYTSFVLGIMFIAMGISELKEKRKLAAYSLFIVSAFNIFVSIYIFLNNR